MNIFKSNSIVCGIARAGENYFAVQLEQKDGALFVRDAREETIRDAAGVERLRRFMSSGPCYAAISRVDGQEHVIIRSINITKDISSRKIAAAVKTQMEEHTNFLDENGRPWIMS